ncbi:MAG: GMC family oxidoreductase [Betaproteobacteria bacterium]
MSSDYAYIIVGSGVAGSTIATKLLERDPGTPILMLEAGPRIPMKDRRYWWDYVLYGRKAYDPCEDRDADNPSVGLTPWHSKGSRTMMYGGSTVHWGGWSMRFKPEDFHLKTNTGRGGDWPYGYDTMEPYYCRADEYLSVCGDDKDSADRSSPASARNKNDPWRSKPYPLPPYPWTESDGEMIEAFNALGITPGRMPLARYRKCMATGTCKYCPFGARFSGSYIMDDLLNDPEYPNLKFIGMAPVTRLVAESKSRIHKVEYTDPATGETATASGDRIILCAGAYEVPKLLLLSSSYYWENGIGNDHDLVGRYAISHPFLSVAGTKDMNNERWIQEFDFPTLMSRTYDKEENQQNGKIFLMKSAMFPNVDLAAHMIAGRDRSAIDRIVTGPRQVQLSAFMEEMGQYDNRFSLGEGTTSLGLPRTRISFSHPPDFRERAGKNLDLMEAVVRQMGYNVDKKDRLIGEQDGHHTSSTCRMGKDPTEGVVDADLKVFGTDNLYVCSNAVHPTCAAVNPTLTLVAVTLKLTDHLLSQNP